MLKRRRSFKQLVLPPAILDGSSARPLRTSPLVQFDGKNLARARITTINEANGQPHPTSRGNGSLLAFRKFKDALVVALLLLAIVALTGGWVFALGAMALKLIKWIFA
jgi:hypothetical protein